MEDVGIESKLQNFTKRHIRSRQERENRVRFAKFRLETIVHEIGLYEGRNTYFRRKCWCYGSIVNDIFNCH